MQGIVIGTCVFLGASALWWFAMRRQIRRGPAEIRSEVSAVQAELKRLEAEWRERDLENPKPRPPRNGFNLNCRAEAVRGIRAGHSPERLSAGLGWSAPEISLLIKIEQIQGGTRNSA